MDGRLAQRFRASASHAEGHRFKSRIAHHCPVRRRRAVRTMAAAAVTGNRMHPRPAGGERSVQRFRPAAPRDANVFAPPHSAEGFFIEVKKDHRG